MFQSIQNLQTKGTCTYSLQMLVSCLVVLIAVTGSDSPFFTYLIHVVSGKYNSTLQVEKQTIIQQIKQLDQKLTVNGDVS